MRKMGIIEGVYARIYSLVVMTWLIMKNNHTLYVYMWPHIGDVCIAMSYLKAYREQKKIDSITLLIKQQNYELCNSYENTFDNVVFFNEKQLFKLSKSRFVIRFLKKLHISIDKHFVCTTPFLFDDRLLHSEEITAGLLTKRVIYDIKGNVSPVYPKMPTIDSEAYKLFCKEKDKVIIAPFASSANEIENGFWEELANELMLKGYSVYTNVTKDREDIKGTKRLDCSIVELLGYAENANVFISLRSGIVDLVAGCKCKKIVIYNDYKFPELYDLTSWGNNDSLFQLFGEPSIEKILELL